MCYVGLVYPRPRFGLLSRGEAVRGEPAQYISMRAPETTVVVPINGSHYRDSQYYECEQTGFGRSTALSSSARSRMTSRISPWCATLVWSTHGLVSAFFHVGRQFGASRPNTLACGLRKRPWSFLMGVTIVTPNRLDVETKGSTRFRIPTALSCSVPSAARTLLRAGGILSKSRRSHWSRRLTDLEHKRFALATCVQSRPCCCT